jgi:hypothetical protein
MWFLAIMAVISAAVSAVGMKQAAVAQEKSSEYNADINKKNAEAANQQGMFDAEQTRIRNKRLLSAQQAAYSASGVDPNAGSATDVKQDSTIEGEMDALVALYTGKSSANAFNNRSGLNQMQAGYARTSGNIGAASSLLGGAGQAYGALNPKF